MYGGHNTNGEITNLGKVEHCTHTYLATSTVEMTYKGLRDTHVQVP